MRILDYYLLNSCSYSYLFLIVENTDELTLTSHVKAINIFLIHIVIRISLEIAIPKLGPTFQYGLEMNILTKFYVIDSKVMPSSL